MSAHRPSARRAIQALGLTLGLLMTGCAGGSDAEPVSAQPESADQAELKLRELGSFADPVGLVASSANEQYVVERAGRIRSLDRRQVLLDLRDRIDTTGEGGLLSASFGPGRADDLLYVAYSTRDSLRVEQYYLRGGSQPDPHRVVLSIDHPNDIHWGGQLSFGPDGYLYLATGDGGPLEPQPDTAQDLSNLRGKLLRIDPQRGGDRAYRIPSDNPLVGRLGRDEIYAWGLRNPWRYSFDAKTKTAWIADVGYGRAEEINGVSLARLRAANFGWPNYEGDLRRRGGLSEKTTTSPRNTYDHDGRDDGSDPCAVTGGYVVRDPNLGPLVGEYVFGDYCRGKVMALDPATNRARSLGLATIPGLASFAEDAERHLYIVSLRGTIFQLVRS